MPDVLTPQQRHRCMSHIRSKATKPEMAVGTRIPVQAERQERAGQAGYSDAQIQNGDFCQRLFLMKRNRRTEIASGGWYEE